jgi:uncharacterized protein DUF1549/uncharacterized protein DUF1553
VKNWLRSAFLVFPILAVSSAECTYLENPDHFLYTPAQHWREISGWTDRVARQTMKVADTGTMPRKNLIDEYIFGRMERDGIQPAPLSDDQEFLRRVYLDVTGRIPSVEQVRSFINDTNPAKRDLVIDSLIGTDEFVDKWTMFLGDLFKNDGPSSNVNRYLQGRDAFYTYLRQAVSLNKPYWRIAQELISATGETFKDGATNWIVGGTVPMGPIQDTYDGQAVSVAQTFLGINAVDCLLCHDGARHLDAVNLWGKQQKRSDMWGLSAFFARTQMRREVVNADPFYARYIVSDLPSGDYLLNTRIGNRTAREPVENAKQVDPRYPFNGQTFDFGLSRRQTLAMTVTWDPQFARAAVNYIWEKLMVEALVSPSNSFDLARLDPENPPPAPWTLQPANPELLEALSRWFRDNNMDLRQLIALIAKSNAYQLSSSYPDAWRAAYVPYYARKFARRLDAEEIHDAVVKATGILPRYTMDYVGVNAPLPPVSWAMQLPDTREPRSNAQVAQFLNSFGRGDRDVNFRSSNGSILQALNMMNNNFVMTRIHADDNGSNVQRLLRLTSDPARIIEELYLSTLSRYPAERELAAASDVMRRAGTRRGTELLQWALLNKLEFLFSY